MVAARAGLRTGFQFQSLEQVLEEIRQGKLDATVAVSPTAERAQELFLSKGTTTFTLSIFARKEERTIHGVQSLAGKTLATYQGYSWNVHYSELLGAGAADRGAGSPCSSGNIARAGTGLFSSAR
jgi:ABC-type amino acid transport substrate-binding protein